MKETAFLLKEIPPDHLPREKLQKLGPTGLSDAELLAIILRTGNKENNVLGLSMEMIRNFEGLYHLKMASLEELMKYKGIGITKAIELQAIFEFGRRLEKANLEKGRSITSTSQGGNYFLALMKDYTQEHVIAIYLNTKNEIIKQVTVFIGGLNSSVAHPREIYRHALKLSAARLLIAHNHPSGNPTPSEADIQFTKRLAEVGEIMGIELLDHFIVGNESYISLLEMGVL